MDLTFKKNELVDDIFLNHHKEHINIQILKPEFQVISFNEKIGGSHQINKDWKISECSTVVLKPKLKEVTFNRELLTYYVISTNEKFKELYTFMSNFHGVYSFNKELYIGVSNITRIAQTPNHEKENRIIDIKIGHNCFDKLMYGSKPEKEVYYKKGWRVIGLKSGKTVSKYIGQDKKNPKDGNKEDLLLKEFLFSEISEENKRIIKDSLYTEIMRIKDYFESERRIDLISGSILISINVVEIPKVNVKIIDLAHTYFYSEENGHQENSRIFFKGISAFINDLEDL